MPICRAHTSSSPTLGRVRPRSPCTNSLTYVPAEVVRKSVKKCGLCCTTSMPCMTFVRASSERRCMTRIGVICRTCNDMQSVRHLIDRYMRDPGPSTCLHIFISCKGSMQLCLCAGFGCPHHCRITLTLANGALQQPNELLLHNTGNKIMAELRLRKHHHEWQAHLGRRRDSF
jgi:hypothetical protein